MKGLMCQTHAKESAKAAMETALVPTSVVGNRDIFHEMKQSMLIHLEKTSCETETLDFPPAHREAATTPCGLEEREASIHYAIIIVIMMMMMIMQL